MYIFFHLNEYGVGFFLLNTILHQATSIKKSHRFYTAQKMKKSLMEDFFFCAVLY